MVKADFDRDYYGDLEIDQDATVEEIKKQFRKLGMKNLHLFSFPARSELILPLNSSEVSSG